mgnify:CR=1 FL=1
MTTKGIKGWSYLKFILFCREITGISIPSDSLQLQKESMVGTKTIPFITVPLLCLL